MEFQDSRKLDSPSGWLPEEDNRLTRERHAMVERQLRRRGIANPRVLAAMEATPRHAFVSESQQVNAYGDAPLPIGHQQTISQPYIVALMTELAKPRAEAKVLEIGTGCGYQTAILARLFGEVFSIEVVPALAAEAKTRLEQMGFGNIHLRCGDGSSGWPEHAPYDAILAAAAPTHIPRPLIEQLAPGGRLVLPVGRYEQRLVLLEKNADGRIIEQAIAPVAFVPMTGNVQDQRD